MKEKVILPIEENTYLKSYSHHTDMLAVIANDNYVGESMAVISDLQWEFGMEKVLSYEYFGENLRMEQEGNTIEVKGNEYGKDLNCIFFNQGKGNCTFTVKLEGQKFTNPWANTSIYIAKKDDFEKGKYECGEFLFGHCCRSGIFSTQEMEEMKNLPNRIGFLEYPVRLKVSMQEDKISCYYSYDDVNFIKEKEISNPYSSEYAIGVVIENSKNQFYDWFFSNYIQIHCDNQFSNNSGVPIDFHFAIEKYHWAYYFNYFMDYDNIKRDIIKNMGIDFVEYVKENIRSRGYVEVRLNEFYIEDRAAYQKYPFEHDNVIYGFDDEEEKFYILGYACDNIVRCSTVPYQAISDSFYDCDSCNHNVAVLRYNVDYVTYDLNIKLIIRLLKEYLDGVNSGLHMENLTVTKRNRSFGIKVYDVILNSEENFNTLLIDIRILHLIYEHKKCMLDRVKFLVCRGVIEEDAEFIEEFNALYDMSLRARNVCLKNIIKASEKNCNKIKTILLEMKTKEQELYPKLIFKLTDYVNRNDFMK